MRYALNENKRVHAFEAELRKDYLCPDCNGIVRKNEHSRLGIHFRHNRACDYAKRALAHLFVQQTLFEMRPNLKIEYPMKGINRIADLVDLEKKFVYEIQCSPIKKWEVKARNRAYKKLGFTVIWILHDWFYNKKVMSDAEEYLRIKGVYFTSINEKGKGLVYKQQDLVRKNIRYFKARPIPAHIDQKPDPMPQALYDRIKWAFQDYRERLLLIKAFCIPKQVGKVKTHRKAKGRMNRPFKREKFL